ncbi:DMT family transporter [Candidatus Peregrinibacteria bacterium]|nr:DMT family transporter [Candidatus Peregrinibacteria bacterium]
MNNNTVAFIGGMMGMIGYGTADFFSKKTVDKIGIIKSLLYAKLIETVILSIFLLKDSSLPRLTLKNIIFLALFSIFSTIGYLALYKGFKIGKISIISSVTSTQVVITAIFSFLVFGEIFSKYKIIALIFIIIGIFFTAVNVKELKNNLRAHGLSKGVLEASCVVIIFGAWIPLWDQFVEGPGWIIWSLFLNIFMMGILFFYGIFFKKKFMRLGKGAPYFWILFIAIFEGMANIGNTWAFNGSNNTTSIITAITSSYPLITVMLGYVFLRERLALSQYLGITSIIIGLSIMPFL